MCYFVVQALIMSKKKFIFETTHFAKNVYQIMLTHVSDELFVFFSSPGVCSRCVVAEARGRLCAYNIIWAHLYFHTCETSVSTSTARELQV